ncbi:MAG: hypothetical protein VYA55_03715 [Pseudomonadota bacterium]|nr:hypothetical protein [Pseudomonadota bacterium]
MWYKKSILPAAAVLVAATTFGANQAYALNDDEAAVLVGLAVGTVAAVAVKHHREHDRRDWEHRERSRYDDHHHGYRRQPQRVEHYVIHNPPSYRGDRHRHDRCDHPGKRHGHKRKDYDRGYSRSGYEYEYEYKKRVRF